ncbi:MAG: choline/carnitine O-acyltransferase, partial [Cyanobacteria bacterium P01_F01_bin.3]
QTTKQPVSLKSLPPLQSRSPLQLTWDLNADITSSLVKAEADFTALTSQLKVKNVCLEGLGEGLASSHQVDELEAIVHLILQLAYFRCYGQIDNIYQPISTRHFHHGRTAVLHPVTNASVKFVEQLEQVKSLDAPDSGDFLKRLKSMLNDTIAAYTDRKALCLKGDGVDRHLFALQQLAQQQYMTPDIFQDEAYTQALTQYRIATSGFTDAFLNKFTGQAEKSYGMRLGAFGPGVGEGYGVSYSISRDRTQLTVTSWSAAIKPFILALHQAATDVITVLTSEVTAK